MNFTALDQASDRMIDLEIKNVGPEPARFLRGNFPPEVTWQLQDRVIAPGQSTFIRIKFTPRKKGSYREFAKFWYTTDQEPTVVRLKADVEYVERGADPACPDFSTRPTGGVERSGCLIRVVDARTGAPLRKARLRVIQNGLVDRTFETDREGEVEKDFPVAYYMLVADHEGYYSNDVSDYINKRNNYFVIPLEPRELAIEENQTLEGIKVIEAVPEEMDVTEEISIRIDFSTEEDEVEPVEVPEPQIVDTSSELPESKFAQNNVIFLVDVSHSMAQKGKMDILKASMLELTQILRGIDRMALITYASKPE
ncbi:MAG: VWA domain-containing protein, partial [Flavobacteriales bacterium]|nr:VWA domain-containing protein [Flavobacteriales bacterium]